MGFDHGGAARRNLATSGAATCGAALQCGSTLARANARSLGAFVTTLRPCASDPTATAANVALTAASSGDTSPPLPTPTFAGSSLRRHILAIMRHPRAPIATIASELNIVWRLAFFFFAQIALTTAAATATVKIAATAAKIALAAASSGGLLGGYGGGDGGGGTGGGDGGVTGGGGHGSGEGGDDGG